MKKKIFILAITSLTAGILFLPQRHLINACWFKKPNVTIMTYNAENLFDTVHDEGKDDYTYLPLEFKLENKTFIEEKCPSNPHWRKSCLEMDWSKKRLETKLEHFSASILKNSKKNKGPDVLMLQEVENLRVLKMLQGELNRKTSGDKYKHAILIEGPDERGIDTAILSKLPLAPNTSPVLHKVKLKRDYTRGILQADFQLPSKEILSVLVFHFPSQRSPVEKREIGFNRLNEIGKAIQKKHPERLIIAGGDSNVINKEHHIFTDLTEDFWDDSLEFSINKEKGVGGTHYYRGHWSTLDVFLMNHNLSDEESNGYHFNKKSIRIATAYSRQKYKNRNGDVIPSRYSHPKYYGVSDHYPVMLELEYK